MGVEEKIPQGVGLTTMESVLGWAHARSPWPVTMGLACCAIEMMAFGATRFDGSRIGMEVFRASPRQSDIMIVSGRVSQKMAPVVRNIYDELMEPKWVISMGVCASSGGMFNNYSLVQGIDHLVPVDIYLPGCPPRPEMLINAVFELRNQLMEKRPIGQDRIDMCRAAEEAALKAEPLTLRKGLLA
ncbi:MAG: NADH-quinone oxidoreductase subunit B [Actinomycetaceae bacterium]|nr:NADH-quinone oxidoreductase subunit B [Arcanobacterium sp.]MDD7505232.1 NADH-quinone oxidoreductase subunit B [Actinomycetaceae bacterium]MDY6143320.1 NADH-quinone oxidoreductase subunit B family protein [Arcanobacterium sp.]